MTHYAVKLYNADGSCAIFGTAKPVPIIIEVEDPLAFPDGHTRAVALAAEATGIDVDSSLHGMSVEPIEYVLDLKLRGVA